MSVLHQLGRAAGILLHPTSLPSAQIDQDAYRWIDLLAAAGVKVWQMLPLGVPLVGLSPYQCASAFAINPALFPVSVSTGHDNVETQRFAQWYSQQQHWVDDYALFMVIKQQVNAQEWAQWPTELRQRDPQALEQIRIQYAGQLSNIIEQQYHFHQQWQALREYARQREVYLFGDMPIFVAYDSADVWAHPQRFLLDEQGIPTLVTGVPPDYFSATGQRWGNPHYHWDYMREEHFLWWKQRLAYHFEFFDLVRIDHFRGLAASWMIPAEHETAMDGYWQAVPGDEMLASIQQTMGELPLVAEDLGSITPDVIALRDKYDLPGMSVLQFGFDHFDDNLHKSQNVRENTVYYIGTHDNDTLLGWFTSLDEGMRAHVMHVLEIDNPAQITTAMLDTVLGSRALLAVIPLQDLLGLGTEARMNIPGLANGNWTWRFDWAQISDTMASELHHRLQEHQRNEREFATTTTRDSSRSV